MNLNILIAVLLAVLICLLAMIPMIDRFDIPDTYPSSESAVLQQPSTIAPDSMAETTVTQPSTEPSTEPITTPPTQAQTQPPTQAPTQPQTQPQTQPPTQSSTQPTTRPSQDGYSDIPKVNAFITERMTKWTCPVRAAFGEVTGSRRFATSRGGGKRAHAGLDFVAPHGTKVYAITSGTVQRIAVFYQSTLAVEVANDDGSILRYCEIATDLKVGDYVQQGDVIGTIMRADGGTEMLHMEVYLGDEEGMLTQSGNRTYKYVDDSKYYVRRSDLLDPTFLKDLPKG